MDPASGTSAASSKTEQEPILGTAETLPGVDRGLPNADDLTTTRFGNADVGCGAEGSDGARVLLPEPDAISETFISEFSLDSEKVDVEATLIPHGSEAPVTPATESLVDDANDLQETGSERPERLCVAKPTTVGKDDTLEEAVSLPLNYSSLEAAGAEKSPPSALVASNLPLPPLLVITDSEEQATTVNSTPLEQPEPEPKCSVGCEAYCPALETTAADGNVFANMTVVEQTDEVQILTDASTASVDLPRLPLGFDFSFSSREGIVPPDDQDANQRPNGANGAQSTPDVCKSTEFGSQRALSYDKPQAYGARNSSLPPHLRPNHHSTQQPAEAEAPKYPAIIDGNRPYSMHFQGMHVYRSRAQQYPQQPQRGEKGRERQHRLETQLERVTQDFESEHQSHKTTRKAFEAEARKKAEAALYAMLAELLSKQIAVVEASAGLEKRELDLQHREEQIKELEIFLGEGQKQLWYARESKGWALVDDISLHHARQQGEIDARARFRHEESELAVQQRRLTAQMGALKFRENAYKLHIRNTVEEEVRATLTPEIEARVADEEYERGFDAGMKVADKDSLHDGFVQGYAACRDTQNRLTQLRAGKIPFDSPELDFLTDPTHPENPYNRGLQLGRRGGSTTKQGSTTVEKKRFEQAEEQQQKPYTPSPPVEPKLRSGLNLAVPTYNGYPMLAKSSVRKLTGTSAYTNGAAAANKGASVGNNATSAPTNGTAASTNGNAYNANNNATTNSGPYTTPATSSRRFLRFEEDSDDDLAPRSASRVALNARAEAAASLPDLIDL